MIENEYENINGKGRIIIFFLVFTIVAIIVKVFIGYDMDEWLYKHPVLLIGRSRYALRLLWD